MCVSRFSLESKLRYWILFRDTPYSSITIPSLTYCRTNFSCNSFLFIIIFHFRTNTHWTSAKPSTDGCGGWLVGIQARIRCVLSTNRLHCISNSFLFYSVTSLSVILVVSWITLYRCHDHRHWRHHRHHHGVSEVFIFLYDFSGRDDDK